MWSSTPRIACTGAHGPGRRGTLRWHGHLGMDGEMELGGARDGAI